MKEKGGQTVKKMKTQKRILKTCVVLLLWGMLFTGCSLFPGEPAEMESGDTGQPAVTEAEKAESESLDTATFAPTSTATRTQGPTLTPTERLTWTPFPTKTLRPTWTPSPTLSPTATKDIGWIIKDDFSDTDRGWLVGSGSNWEMGYKNGGYFMTVEEEWVEITSTPVWLKLDDTRVIADVYRDWGKGYWGISCREAASASYYTMFITNEGTYGYGETRNGQVQLHPLGQSPDILTTKFEINRIMADCRGNHLTLYVNGVFLFKKEVSGIGSGWVGMMAGTTEDQNQLTVVFDYIEIWGPIEEEGD
jgi:hypothetical protein